MTNVKDLPKISKNSQSLYVPYSLIKRLKAVDACLISAAIAGWPLIPAFTKNQISKARKKYGSSLLPEEIKSLVSNHEGFHECEWCGYKCFVLHEHHYPIPKISGGNRLVKICGKCHADYHWLQANKWFTEKTIEELLKLPLRSRPNRKR